MNGAPGSVRGVDDKGTTPRREQERNVPKGNVIPVVPDRTYNIVGFDIGKSSLNKAGIQENLDPVLGPAVRRLVTADDRHPTVVITGHASESRLTGKGRKQYADERAEAVRDYLIKQGVHKEWIRMETSASNSVSARDQSSTGKAAARAATVDFRLAGEKRGTADRYVEPVYYIKGQRHWEWNWDWLNVPKLPPIRGRERVPGGGDEPPDTSERKKPVEPLWKRLLPKDHRPDGPSLAGAGLMILAGLFWEEYVTAVALEYGEEKIRDYVKKKLKEELKKRDDAATRKRFMNEMLRRINAKKNHPLSFLVNPVTGNWVGRMKGMEFVPAVQAGHTFSHSGGGFTFALEGADFNQTKSNTIETKEGVAWSLAFKVDDVPVEAATGAQWVRLGKIPKKVWTKARPTVGWIGF